ncbi:MAG: transglutaminase-like domain-containing protein [Caldimicrobium sp.]
MNLLKVFSVLLILFLPFSNAFAGKERFVQINWHFDLNAPKEAKIVRLWIPYPISNTHQTISDIEIKGNFDYSGVYTENNYSVPILYLEWRGPKEKREANFNFKVKRKEAITKNFPKKEYPLSTIEHAKFLSSHQSLPISPKVRELALKITKDEKTVLGKARAIYNWIVNNMRRDPQVKGCGLGEVDKLLVSLGGKCADIHAVFVSLARAAGVPAREIYGIRIPQGKEGDMTKAQHCWAEFYLPNYGWVVVDPADVLKAKLEKNPSPEELEKIKEYFFGAVDESRIAFNIGRDLILNPPQKGEPLIYFMYPYAEADGVVLNEDLFGFNLGWKITFKEIK